MDHTDRKILVALLDNGRESVNRIARKSGVSRDVVRYRMRQMEASGIITAYVTRVDQAVFAQGIANMLLKIAGGEAQMRSAIEYLEAHPRTNWIAEIAGTHDLVVNVLYLDTADLGDQIATITTALGTSLSEHRLSQYITEYKFSRKGLLSDDEMRPHNLTFSGKRGELDATDKAILARLITDARSSAADLAKELHIGPDAVRQRMKRLETHRVIQGYTIVLNPERLGMEGYHVELRLQQMTKKTLAKMSSWANGERSVAYCAQMVGEYNIVLTIYARDREHFRGILRDLRDTFAEETADCQFQLHIQVHKEIFLPPALLH